MIEEPNTPNELPHAVRVRIKDPGLRDRLAQASPGTVLDLSQSKVAIYFKPTDEQPIRERLTELGIEPGKDELHVNKLLSLFVPKEIEAGKLMELLGSDIVDFACKYLDDHQTRSPER